MNEFLITNYTSTNDTVKVNGSELIDSTIKIIVQSKEVSTSLDWGLFFTIITPILIAIIAGIFALKQVKQNVYMSSRVKWVEDYRDLISKYISAVMNTSSSISTYKSYEDNYNDILGKMMDGESSSDCNEALDDSRNRTLEWHKTYSENNNKFNIYSNKVLLYLDAEAKNHLEIIELINKVDKVFKQNKDNMTCELFCDDLKVIRELSNAIIKLELDNVLPKANS